MTQLLFLILCHWLETPGYVSHSPCSPSVTVWNYSNIVSVNCWSKWPQLKHWPKGDIPPRGFLLAWKGLCLSSSEPLSIQWGIGYKKGSFYGKDLCRVVLCLCWDACSKVDESWTNRSEWDVLLCCEFRKPTVGFTSQILGISANENYLNLANEYRCNSYFNNWLFYSLSYQRHLVFSR